MRAKYSALLKTAEGKEEESEEAGAEEGDADITFIPGLKDSLSKALKEKEKEKEKEAASLSVYEQYKQKMKEKNKKAWACAAGVRRSVIDDGKEETGLFADLDKAPKKGKKGKKGRKEAETEEEKKKREELELLMIDEVGVAMGCDGQGTEKKEDFNMVETKKALKTSKKRKEEVEDNFEVAAATRGQV